MMVANGRREAVDLALLQLLLFVKSYQSGLCLGDGGPNLDDFLLGGVQLGPGNLEISLSLVELDLRRTELLVLGPGLPKLGFQVLLCLLVHLEEFHQGVSVLLLLESLPGSAYLDQLGLQSLYLGPSVCLELGGHVLLILVHVVVIAGPGRVLREGLEGVGGPGGWRGACG
jgi:hypothetical protein